MRLLILVSVLVLVVILVPTSSHRGFAEDKHTDEVPFLPLLGSCIDFDSDSDCWPFGESGDGDPYTRNLELAVGSNPDDGESTPEHGLFDEQMLSDTCRDSVDNDLDGKKDSADLGCRLTCHSFVAGAICTDQDHDAWLAYIEEELGSDPRDSTSTPEVPGLPALTGVCTDGIDNDQDGLIDSQEPSCGLGECIDFDGDTTCNEPF
jgi:hypothetical protein